MMNTIFFLFTPQNYYNKLSKLVILKEEIQKKVQKCTFLLNIHREWSSEEVILTNNISRKLCELLPEIFPPIFQVLLRGYLCHGYATPE